MIIQVKLSGILRDRHPELSSGDRIDIQLSSDATVDDLLQRLHFHRPGEVVVIMNRQVQKPGNILHDGDCVTVLPVVEGG